jgi:hypothetical protein
MKVLRLSEVEVFGQLLGLPRRSTLGALLELKMVNNEETELALEKSRSANKRLRARADKTAKSNGRLRRELIHVRSQLIDLRDRIIVHCSHRDGLELAKDMAELGLIVHAIETALRRK